MLRGMKTKGNIAFKANQLLDAFEYYSKALNIDHSNDDVNAKLFFNRATVSFKVKIVFKLLLVCYKYSWFIIMISVV